MNEAEQLAEQKHSVLYVQVVYVSSIPDSHDSTLVFVYAYAQCLHLNIVMALALHGSALLCMVSRRPDHSETILERQTDTDHRSVFPLHLVCSGKPLLNYCKIGVTLMFRKAASECECAYLQLSSGHFENKLHHGADSETSRAGGVDLVPNGVAVHLETQNTQVSHLSKKVREL